MADADCLPEDHAPSVEAGWALAHERLALADAERAEYLRRAMSTPDPDEFDDPPVLDRADNSGACSHPRCPRKARARGLCDWHYRRARRGHQTEREAREARKDRP